MLMLLMVNFFDSRNDDLERMWVKFANMNKHEFVAVTYFPNKKRG